MCTGREGKEGRGEVENGEGMKGEARLKGKDRQRGAGRERQREGEQK